MAHVQSALPPIQTPDPRGQIDRIFELARAFDVDIDLHLDFADTTIGMNIDYVCAKTEVFGWGGRVAVGHMSQMSFLPKADSDALARRLADCGIAVTVLPSTDLYLMGRSHDHAIPRGVVCTEPLRAAGVTCSISTNNVLNPFTPYGDGSMIRMANLYANICQVATPGALSACLDMITTEPARLLRLKDYGIAQEWPPISSLSILSRQAWLLRRLLSLCGDSNGAVEPSPASSRSFMLRPADCPRTPSTRLSPNLRRSCARQRQESRTRSGPPSGSSLTPSNPTKAETT